ncbi:MAG: hypothetical protein ACMVO3_15275 [Thalassobaculum sp.]
MKSLAKHFDASTWTPPSRICPRRRATAFCTAPERRRSTIDLSTTGCGATRPTKPFEGVIPNIDRRWKETDSSWVREELGRVPVRRPLPGLRRPASEAGGPGGEDRRADHFRR